MPLSLTSEQRQNLVGFPDEAITDMESTTDTRKMAIAEMLLENGAKFKKHNFSSSELYEMYNELVLMDEQENKDLDNLAKIMSAVANNLGAFLDRNLQALTNTQVISIVCDAQSADAINYVAANRASLNAKGFVGFCHAALASAKSDEIVKAAEETVEAFGSAGYQPPAVADIAQYANSAQTIRLVAANIAIIGNGKLNYHQVASLAKSYANEEDIQAVIAKITAQEFSGVELEEVLKAVVSKPNPAIASGGKAQEVSEHEVLSQVA